MKKWITLCAAAAALFTLSGRPSQAEVFPVPIDLMHDELGTQDIGLYGQVTVKRDAVGSNWRWTYTLENKTVGRSRPSTIPTSKPWPFPIHHFYLTFDEYLTPDWADHVWGVSTSKHYNTSNVLTTNFQVAGSVTPDAIEWDWETPGTSDDFTTGTMEFSFITDYQHVNQSMILEAGNSLGPGEGTGPGPAATPEPASMALLLGGAAPMIVKLRRRRTAKTEEVEA